MPLNYKILSALVIAGVAVMAAVVLGLWWFNTSALPVLRRNNLEILMIPGMLVSLFLMGVVWYKIFIGALRLLRADMDAE